jgi:hypothetical protein
VNDAEHDTIAEANGGGIQVLARVNYSTRADTSLRTVPHFGYCVDANFAAGGATAHAEPDTALSIKEKFGDRGRIRVNWRCFKDLFDTFTALGVGAATMLDDRFAHPSASSVGRLKDLGAESSR